MTSKTESQLMTEINAEMDTLFAKFKENELVLAAALVTLDALNVTNATELGTATAATIAADLVILNTEADTMLTASA